MRTIDESTTESGGVARRVGGPDAGSDSVSGVRPLIGRVMFGELARRLQGSLAAATAEWERWKQAPEDMEALGRYTRALRRAWYLREAAAGVALGVEVVFETGDARVIRLGSYSQPSTLHSQLP